MSLLQTLVRARDFLQGGWKKGTYFDRNEGCFCLLGALVAADSGKRLTELKGEEAGNPNNGSYGLDWNPPQGVCKALGFKSGHEIIEWNDDPKRRKFEVMERLDAAITKVAGAVRTAQKNRRKKK